MVIERVIHNKRTAYEASILIQYMMYMFTLQWSWWWRPSRRRWGCWCTLTLRPKHRRPSRRRWGCWCTLTLRPKHRRPSRRRWGCWCTPTLRARSVQTYYIQGQVAALYYTFLNSISEGGKTFILFVFIILFFHSRVDKKISYKSPCIK